mgnify:CR=1 FL=1
MFGLKLELNGCATTSRQPLCGATKQAAVWALQMATATRSTCGAVDCIAAATIMQDS